MSSSKPISREPYRDSKGRRAPGIWIRRTATGAVTFEITWRDADGRQRRQRIRGGVQAARKALADKHSRRARGESPPVDARLTFGKVADAWLAGPVAGLRPNTRITYRNVVENHLAPAIGHRRLAGERRITADDLARLVAQMRSRGYSEWTISTVLMVAGQVFRHAQRRLGWQGVSPTTQLERGERPHTSAAAKRIPFRVDELPAVIDAAAEPFKTLFMLAAVTAGRESELLGLRWDNIDLDDADAATVTFTHQVDRRGIRSPLKTDDSAGTLPLPRFMAVQLLEHRDQSPHGRPQDFVFATRTGKPINQRNVLRALRSAMEAAVDPLGQPLFPILHARDDNGNPVPVPGGALPCFHSFRHTAASRAFADGDRVEEVAWLLRHRSARTTQAIYLHEDREAAALSVRRAKMATRMAALDRSGRGRT